MFTTVLFYVLALVLVVAAFRVVSAASPVTAVLHLILVFFTAAMIWMTLGAEFLSLLLIVVYVGAVMVMFLFVIMLVDVRHHTVTSKLKPYLPTGIVIGLIMVGEMAFVLLRAWGDAGAQALTPENYNNTEVLGSLMYSQYVFAVQLGGIILLVGMVAAIALTLRRREGVKRTDSAAQVRVRASDRLRMVSMEAVVAKPAAELKEENAGENK